LSYGQLQLLCFVFVQGLANVRLGAVQVKGMRFVIFWFRRYEKIVLERRLSKCRIGAEPCRSSICRCGFGGIVVGTIAIYCLMKPIVRTLTTLALLREFSAAEVQEIF
jgi:hypothetical protein